MQQEIGQENKKKWFFPLENGKPYAMNMSPSRIDGNVLFALNRAFGKEKIRDVRKVYHL